MTHKQMQEKKKRERAKRAKETVLVRREADQARKKKAEMLKRKDAQMQPKQKPIVNTELRKLKIDNKLATTIQKLEAMERKYMEEHQKVSK
jgi:hypothetical protein